MPLPQTARKKHPRDADSDALTSSRPERRADALPKTENSGDSELIGKGVRFVKRIYTLRIIGLGIGFFCVAAAFLQNPVAWPWWALLVFHGYIWPLSWQARNSAIC